VLLQKSLFSGEPVGYSFRAAAKSAAGRENPSYFKATQHAPSVFFYVVALAYLYSTQLILLQCVYQTMVAQAGQPSGWPVPLKAGFSPPFGLPPECENSGGSDYRYFKEAITIMATSPIISHSAFTFIFAAVRRSVPNSHPCMVRTIATCEHDARQYLAREYVLSFAGRLPVREVA